MSRTPRIEKRSVSTTPGKQTHKEINKQQTKQQQQQQQKQWRADKI